MSEEIKKIEFRFQWVTDFCWESDPKKTTTRLRPIEIEKGPIKQIGISLHQPMSENPSAGSTPCDHTRSWNLHVSGSLVTKENSPFYQVLNACLDSGESPFNSNESWIKGIQEKLDGNLSPESVNDRVLELIQTYDTFRQQAQIFFDSIAWCVSARSASRVVKEGWFHFFRIDDPKGENRFFDFPSNNALKNWQRDSIDVSNYVPNSIAPFSSIILGEAWSMLSVSDRSSTVLGYISAESAVKECYSNVVEGGEWLVTNTQAPPLPNLLQSMLPSLSENARIELEDQIIWGQVPTNREWCAASSWLEKRASQRNKIVHGNNIMLNIEDVIGWLNLYERLLTLLWKESAKLDSEPESSLYDKFRE